MCLIIDKEKDYYRACKGFSINGINYKRLLGTNGGIKNSTIVFVSERHADELRRRIDNGRNMEQKLVPAKLEAYKALTCSASTPVSFPKGIVVVNDCETEFLSDIVYLTDEADGEPVMEDQKQVPIQMNASDGYGLMLPSLAKQWSEDLGLDYLVSGVNTRFSFEKGMVFTFDFHDYAEKVAGTYIIKDAWGNDVDIRDVDLMLTTSMVKLWDSYDSCDHYIQCCMDNGYTFSVAKTCPKDLEKGQCVIARRDTGEKYFVALEELETKVQELLKAVHDDLYAAAAQRLEQRTATCETMAEAKAQVEEHGGFVETMWCGELECEVAMKEQAGLTSRCMPFAQKKIGKCKCAVCGKDAEKMVTWGVAY